MNQKLSLSLFFSGLATFLMSLGEFFSQHNSWHELSTPSEVGHIIIITASFIIAIIGALGTQLPRDKDTRVGDKIPKDQIVATIIEKGKDSSGLEDKGK